MSIDGTQAHEKFSFENRQAPSCFVGRFQLDAFVLVQILLHCLRLMSGWLFVRNESGRSISTP